MITTEMNRTTSDAVRDELTAIGTGHSRLQSRQRRARAIAVTLGVVALAGATTGAAIVVSNLPGETTVAPLGEIVSAEGAGTQQLDLGAAPADAGTVIVDITCTSDSGTISLSTIPSAGTTGSGVEIDCDERRTPVHITDVLLPSAGSTTITITADAGTTWNATAQYASSSTSEWGVNDDGQTFGVPNVNGVPDLTAAYATNGKQGYIVTEDLWEFDGEGSINVYESDGVTVIGEFDIQNG